MAHPHVLDVAALCRAVQQARHHATTEALFTYAGAFQSLRETVLHEIQRRLEKEDVPRSTLGHSGEASQEEPDEALTACQCAGLSGWKRSAAPGQRAGFSPRWFYDHADELPFRIGGRGRTPIRFSSRGLRAWL